MQVEYDEETYMEIMSDLSYYHSAAEVVIDSFNIKIIHCSDEYIFFIKSTNEEIKYKRKELEGDMIFFNVDKELMILHSFDFDKEAMLRYFNK